MTGGACEHGEAAAHDTYTVHLWPPPARPVRCPGPSNCRAGCPTKDHATWGECARAARIQVDRAALAAGRLDTKRAKGA